MSCHANPNLINNHPKQQLLGNPLQQHLEDHGQGPGGQLVLGEVQEEDWDDLVNILKHYVENSHSQQINSQEHTETKWRISSQ